MAKWFVTPDRRSFIEDKLKAYLRDSYGEHSDSLITPDMCVSQIQSRHLKYQGM